MAEITRRVPAGAERIQVDGIGLEIVHRPISGAPTMVFLHEGLGSISTWRDFPETLAAACGCGLLVYSRRGYGGSDPVSLPRPLTYMHEEGEQHLPALLNALSIQDPILYGHSDGGSIALVGVGSGRVQAQAMILEAPHVFREDGPLDTIIKISDAFQTTDLRRRLQRHHGDNVDCAFWGWSRAWSDPGFADWNLETYLPGVTIPTLLLQGRDDPYGTLAHVESIARHVQGPCTTTLFEDCGHAPHREQSASVREAVGRFLRTRA